MSLENIKAQLQQKLAMASLINARVKFDFGDDGVFLVDATQTPPVITPEDGDADVTLICAAETFEKILNGTQDPNIAFMMGKLKVQGSMGLALKLNGLLGD